MKNLTSRFAVLMVACAVLCSAVMVGCGGGGEEETTTTTNTVTNTTTNDAS